MGKLLADAAQPEPCVPPALAGLRRIRRRQPAHPATRIAAEGWVLLFGGVLCIAGAWAAAMLQPGLGRYDARNPAP